MTKVALPLTVVALCFSSFSLGFAVGPGKKAQPDVQSETKWVRFTIRLDPADGPVSQTFDLRCSDSPDGGLLLRRVESVHTNSTLHQETW